MTTRYAALAETADCEETFFVDMPGVGQVEDPTGTPEALNDYGERYVAAVLEAIETPEDARRKMMQRAIDDYELDAILPLWLELLG